MATPPPPLGDWRGRFPFTIAAPSWVLPLETDNFVGNVRYLADKVDKVQILCFGRDFVDQLLTPGDLARLAEIRRDSGLRFSVHLPGDLALLDEGSSLVEHAAKLDVLARIFELTACLEPDNCILHLDLPADTASREAGKPSQGRHPAAPPAALVARCLADILARFPGLPRDLQLENTNWDLCVAAGAIRDSGCGVCADFGHLAHRDLPVDAFLATFGPAIRELHLHGFDAKDDHLALPKLGPDTLRTIMAFVRGYRHSVTIENFRADWLEDSLRCLEAQLVD